MVVRRWSVAVILEAVRTPVGRFGGALADVRPDDLGGHAIRAAVTRSGIDPASIDEVWIYFPDPWPKKRHHKRRLVQDEFVSLVASRLRSGGTLRLATDWQPYADWMLDTLGRCELLENESADGAWSPRPASRPPTRFELRGQRLGHEVRDLAFRRV